MLTDYTVVPSFETDSISDRPLRVAVNAGQKVIVDLTMLELFLRNIFPDLEFVQIRGMKRHEVFQTFSTSRLFIDLGSFPGRDRMAREAALLGANVIVARAGSAARHDDFPIPDCYRIAPHDIEKVAILGAHMLQFPELHSPQFESFRQKCREERVKFFGEVLQIFGPMGVLSLR